VKIRERFARLLFGQELSTIVQSVLAEQRDDWWPRVDRTATDYDLDFSARQENLLDVLEAWHKNPFVRRVVNLFTSHVIGRQFRLGSEEPVIDAWVRNWIGHRKNQLQLAFYDWSDELCRAGELFLVLFTNPHDGMQYVRAVPARRIVELETNPDDYLQGLVYVEARNTGLLEVRRWKGWENPEVSACEPVMVHFAINRPVGATRSWGGDLDAMLPSCQRYNQWLKDRVRVNSSRAGWVWKMKAASPDRVAALEEKYKGGLPSGSIWIGMKNEDIDTVNSRVDAGEATSDGRAMRQSIAVGGNVAPHMIGDTEGATRASAEAANAPTFQFWNMRQAQFAAMMKILAGIAVRRAHESGRFLRWLPADLALTHQVADLTREDNLALASAARNIVTALSVMKDQGWIDRETAIGWAAKFAGEDLNIKTIVDRIDAQSTIEEVLRSNRRADLAAVKSSLMSR